jgi:transposase
VVESLGNIEDIRIKANGQDPIEWAKNRAAELTELAKNEKEPEILVKYNARKQIQKNEQVWKNGGYLFLQQIYYQLGLDKITTEISKKYKFEYDLNAILSHLIFSRLLNPGSKLQNYLTADKYLEKTGIELHQIYRALDVINKEGDFIQSQLYKNSQKVLNRDSRILYYDCTNYYFEIEQADGLRQYGHSKENRPNPIVQMGLFMDGNGIPLAFDITSGNTNEQTTLKPLEEKVIEDFDMAKVIVCTDAGLSSTANRKLNDKDNRAFITTQSIKKLKGHLKEWALAETGWHLSGSSVNQKKEYTLTEINELGNENQIFYKERWINENDFEQRLIVSYSLKYKHYQQKIRQGQIDRAVKIISSNQTVKRATNSNDAKRFIASTNVTENGEIADKQINSLDETVIAKEAQYDGFSAVCTNLEDDIPSIIEINAGRWEIEQTFRMFKSDFEARPVHLSRDERIKAHFSTCFITMTIFRILEQKLNQQFTHDEIIDKLRDMNFHSIPGKGAVPLYKRDDLTDALHQQAGFRTDLEIVSSKNLKNIFKLSKSGK